MLNIIRKYRLTTSRHENIQQLGNFKYKIQVYTIDDIDRRKKIATIEKYFEMQVTNKLNIKTLSDYLNYRLINEKKFPLIKSNIVWNPVDRCNDLESLVNYLNNNESINNYDNFEKMCYRQEELFCFKNRNCVTDANSVSFIENNREIIIETESLKKYFNKIQNLSTYIYKLRKRYDLLHSISNNYLNTPLIRDKFTSNDDTTKIAFYKGLPVVIITPIGTINICNDELNYQEHDFINLFNKKLFGTLNLKFIEKINSFDIYQINKPLIMFPQSKILHVDLKNPDNYNKLWTNIKPHCRLLSCDTINVT